ncbi:uncharacterized protein [Dermacentor albipictus]|uniref:uncharacterized protein isoform X1 n=1 Tax=Dermacentor albipictus TaxID=60249 RepID=UPI0038FCFAEE
MNGRAKIFNVTSCHVPDVTPIKSWDSVLHRSSGTCADRWAHNECSAPPHSPPINDVHTEAGLIGHDSTQGMQPPNNPLVFILQLFLGLLLHASPGLEPSGMTGRANIFNVTSCHVPDVTLIKSWDSVLHRSSGTCADRWAHNECSAPPHSPPINAVHTEAGLIGHDSTQGMQPPNNPLVFILQLFLGLLLHASPGLEPSGMTGRAKIFNVTSCHVPDVTLIKSWDSVLHRSSGTCADRWAHNECSAPPHSPPINAVHTEAGLIGHDSTQGMQPPNNPFVFILQVRKRHKKCIRSSDPFLLVLPYPRLCGIVLLC